MMLRLEQLIHDDIARVRYIFFSRFPSLSRRQALEVLVGSCVELIELVLEVGYAPFDMTGESLREIPKGSEEGTGVPGVLLCGQPRKSLGVVVH
jgi:hypothetical protein